MKTYNKREFQKILFKNGYHLDHTAGGHIIYKKDGCSSIVLGRNNCNKMIIQRIIKENSLET